MLFFENRLKLTLSGADRRAERKTFTLLDHPFLRHFQSRTSGISSPCVAMYCLCSGSFADRLFGVGRP